jgi:cytochrome c
MAREPLWYALWYAANTRGASPSLECDGLDLQESWTMRLPWLLGLIGLLPMMSVAVAEGDLGAAEAQFKKSCGTCHVAEADAGPRQGPNLFGVVGRTAGSVEGFNYSPGFVAAKSGIVWDEQTLDRWLTDPQSLIPGAVMPYKQADPDKRKLVIEYLKTRH